MRIFYSFLLIVMSCNVPHDKSDKDHEVKGDTITSPIFSDTVQHSLAEPEVLLPDYDTSKWTDIEYLDSTIQVDMKYATEDNFVKAKMYECSRCFLRPQVALALQAAHRDLLKQGFGLKMLDCFRPRPIQWKLWEKVPDPRYVSDPRKGSMHNRGAAVDLTLVNQLGKELDMGTPFDFFGPEAYPAYTNLPDSILTRRLLLTQTMEAHGFHGIRTEWWHFYFVGPSYELSDMLWKCY